MKIPFRAARGRWGRAVSYLATVLLSALLLWLGNRYATGGLPVFAGAGLERPVKAEVVEVLERSGDSYSLDGGTAIDNVYIDFTARVLAGWQKGQTVTARQTLDGFTPVQNEEVEPGDRVLIFNGDPSTLEGDWMFWEYNRLDVLLVLGAAFAVLVLFFGRGKGVSTLVSLAFTCLAVFAVFIPSILTGKNIYAMAILTCLFTIGMTLMLVNGFDAKGIAAGAGCLGGILVSGGLTLLMDVVLRLTGMVDEESAYLLYMDTPEPIDLKAIIFAAIVIGALGAIMDVAMSIASSLCEVNAVLAKPSFRALMGSGMQIGRDIIGTMANTLVLAYIGSSLSMVLLLIAYNNSLLGLLNRESIVVEILQTLVGSLGILFTVPLTSAVSAFIYSRRAKSSAGGESSGALDKE